MAIYKIQDPNTGKTVTLEGDTPPTEQDLDEIFSQINQQPISGSVTEEQKINPWADAANSAVSGLSSIFHGAAAGTNELAGMAGLQKLPEDQLMFSKEYNYQPQAGVGKGIKAVSSFIPALLSKTVSVPGQALIGGIQGATDAGNRGENPLVGGITGAGVGALGGLAFKGLGKLAPIVAEKMSGIPQGAYNEALTNPTFFKGEWDKNAIKRVLGELEGKYGKQVDEAVNMLPASERIPYNNVIGEIDDLISRSYQGADTSAEYMAARSILEPAIEKHILIPALREAGVPASQMDEAISLLRSGSQAEQLTAEELAMLNRVKAANPGATDNEILSVLGIDKQVGINPADLKIKPSNLHQFKKEIQSKINFNLPESKLQERLLKPIQGETASAISNKSPEYKRVNDMYSALRDAVGKKSELKNITGAIKGANSDYGEKVNNKLLETLQNSKNADEFIRELNKLNQRGYFEQFAPHKVDVKPVSGGNAILGAWTIPAALSGNLAPLLAHLALNAGISPMAQRGFVQLNKVGAKTSPYYTRLLQDAMNSSTRPNEARK
jgi:uncharacterized protein YeeX (DUF496 family)